VVPLSIPIAENGALTCVSEPRTVESTGLNGLVPHAGLAGEDALYNGRNSPMFLRLLRRVGGLAARGGNAGEHVPRSLFADDLELGQGNEESLANTEGRNAIGVLKRACSVLSWG